MLKHTYTSLDAFKMESRRSIDDEMRFFLVVVVVHLLYVCMLYEQCEQHIVYDQISMQLHNIHSTFDTK